MANLSKRTKIILGVIVGLIILWAIYYFVFSKPKQVADAAKAAADAAAAGAAATAAAITNTNNGGSTTVATTPTGTTVV